MISNTNLGALVGAPVLGPDDEKIGTVGQIFVDPTDGHPNWMTVQTGLFGRHESFVPLDKAEWDYEKVRVMYGKDIVKDAPRIDTDAALGASDEEGLYRYYEMSLSGRQSDKIDGSDDADHDDRKDRDADSTNEGGVAATPPVRLQKYVVTEEQAVTVPVTHEEVHLESVPDSDSGVRTDATVRPAEQSDEGASPTDGRHARHD